MIKIIIISSLFVLLIIIALLNTKIKTSTTKDFPTNKNTIKAGVTLATPKIIFVKLLKSGFSPNIVRIKTGETVTWSNESGVDASVNSADHPTHKVNSFLNLGIFSSGSSTQTQFLKKGNFEYHNHLIPSQTGTVIVE